MFPRRPPAKPLGLTCSNGTHSLSHVLSPSCPSSLSLIQARNLGTILIFVTLLLFQWSEGHSVMSDSLRPHGLYSPWNSPGQHTGVGSFSLLQDIFPTQGSIPGLPHCRQILYQLSHQGSPTLLRISLILPPSPYPRQLHHLLSALEFCHGFVTGLFAPSLSSSNPSPKILNCLHPASYPRHHPPTPVWSPWVVLIIYWIKSMFSSMVSGNYWLYLSNVSALYLIFFNNPGPIIILQMSQKISQLHGFVCVVFSAQNNHCSPILFWANSWTLSSKIQPPWMIQPLLICGWIRCLSCLFVSPITSSIMLFTCHLHDKTLNDWDQEPHRTHFYSFSAPTKKQ